MPEPDLFTAYDLHGVGLANRMLMAPMTRTRSGPGGIQGALNVEYYVQRATAGLIITECTSVSPQSGGIMRAPGMYDDAQEAGWRTVVEGVHRVGGRIYLQVWHCGRISHPSLQPDGHLPVAPSAIAAAGKIFTPGGPLPYPLPRPLASGEIAPIIEAFAAATARARRAGFDGVELHGAFGYLPDQFLQDGTNYRTDLYGGSLANRARFMLETAEAMIGAWSAERIGVKLSPSARTYGQQDRDALTTYGHVVRALSELGIGYVHLMEPSPPDLKTGTVQLHEVTRALRPMFKQTVITNGGYDKARGNEALGSGLADLVSFGAPYVANPDLVARFHREPPPLNPPDHATFYGEGPHGYTDYPALAA